MKNPGHQIHYQNTWHQKDVHLGALPHDDSLFPLRERKSLSNETISCILGNCERERCFTGRSDKETWGPRGEKSVNVDYTKNKWLKFEISLKLQPSFTITAITISNFHSSIDMDLALPVAQQWIRSLSLSQCVGPEWCWNGIHKLVSSDGNVLIAVVKLLQ